MTRETADELSFTFAMTEVSRDQFAISLNKVASKLLPYGPLLMDPNFAQFLDNDTEWFPRTFVYLHERLTDALSQFQESKVDAVLVDTVVAEAKSRLDSVANEHIPNFEKQFKGVESPAGQKFLKRLNAWRRCALSALEILEKLPFYRFVNEHPDMPKEVSEATIKLTGSPEQVKCMVERMLELCNLSRGKEAISDETSAILANSASMDELMRKVGIKQTNPVSFDISDWLWNPRVVS